MELNAALSRKMADIEKRKRAANKKDQTKVEDKLRDEIRTLHEAYQFLSRKYMKLAEQRKEAEGEMEEEETESKSKQQRRQRLKSQQKKQDMEIDKMLEENEDLFLDDEDFEEYFDEDEENADTR